MSEQQPLRIGTRGSQLALWQAEHTRAELARVGVPSELVVIKTQGDLQPDLGFDKMEGKGFFTKEIEDALLRGEIDVAVHSLKDLPTEQPEGLVITALSYRDNPADLLLIRREAVETGKIFKVKTGANVGTSAARRKSQMADYRPDLTLTDLRGNVPTRVEKLRQGQYDAVVLAAAGLARLALDLSDLEVITLNPVEFVPAPGQGVLAWQTHRDDLATRRIFKQLHHPDVAILTNVERRVLQLLDGGCQLPLGVHCARDQGGNYHAHVACVLEGAMRRVRLSSSTHVGLADRIVAEIQKA